MSREFNRRELLAATLGVPIMLASCQRSAPAELDFAGEIVGPSVDIGHRIRDGWRAAPNENEWTRVGTVIVGGGIAGLSAAWRLLRAGDDDFVVLELEPAAGGTAQSGSAPRGVSASVRYPWGAHYIPAPTEQNRALVRLLDEMGVIEGTDAEGQPIVGEQFLCRDPQERVFYRGRWYEGLYLHAGATAADVAERKRFDAEIQRWVAWRDGRGRRAFAIPIATASDDAELTALDRISMTDWLTRHEFTSPRLRWLVDYACRDDYGLAAEQTSAWAGLFYFASRIPRPGAEPRPLVTWPEGNGRFVAHFTRKLTRRLRTGMAVLDIVPTETAGKPGADVIAAARDGMAIRGFRAAQVIYAGPQFLARYLIRPWRDNPPPHVAEFRYTPWLVANLFLRGRPEDRGFPLCWDNVLYESPALGYVVATHQTGPEAGPTVLTYYYPFCDADPRQARRRMLELNWRDCVQIVLADLTRAHPDLQPLMERVDVMRWGHAMIGPRVGFVHGAARSAAAEPFRGIHFANTDLSGVALFEEAFYHGIRAAEEILKARGNPSPTML
jgi:protoporphyrinogen oxidase